MFSYVWSGAALHGSGLVPIKEILNDTAENDIFDNSMLLTCPVNITMLSPAPNIFLAEKR